MWTCCKLLDNWCKTSKVGIYTWPCVYYKDYISEQACISKKILFTLKNSDYNRKY